MICYMFPGQPLARETQLPDDPDFAAIAELTREHASFDLETFAWTGIPSTEQVKLQLYGVAMSLYRNRYLRRQTGAPAIVAEHSMGIYPAMAACGAVSEREALELALRIGRCMARMGETEAYALGCVIGLRLEPLLAIAEHHGVYLANHNTSRHFLLAGRAVDIGAAMAEALSAGAFSTRVFPCDAPLHTPLMETVAGELRGIVTGYRYAEPSQPLVNHIDQDALGAAELPDFLVHELCMPVYWERTWQALRRAGATTFVEVGIGDSLKKYNRWIAGEQG
jgi:malonyl CoA-acyl carrier protein transacylase